MPDVEEQSAPRGGLDPGRAAALESFRRSLDAARPDAALPQLIVAQAVPATGADSGMLCGVFGDRIMELARYTDDLSVRLAPGPISQSDLPLALTSTAITGRPLWLSSRSEVAALFPRLDELAGPGGLACAVLPLRADGICVGILGLRYTSAHDFRPAEREYLQQVAEMSALYLRRWTRPGRPARQAPSAARLGRLVHALARADSADEVAMVIAEKGAVAGAEFASLAVLDAGTDSMARLYDGAPGHRETGERYSIVPIDEAVVLATSLRTGSEVWLRSLAEIAAKYPGALADTIGEHAAAVAALPLTDRRQRVIGAIGMAWPKAQAFTETQRDEIRVVARLAADALDRAQQLEAERAARQRTERLQRMMSALVASASLAEVTSAVFEHGLLPFGASAARLLLVDQDQPDRVETVSAVGMAEPALTKWRESPMSAYSPSRKAMTTGEIVYVPTRASIQSDFPEAYISQDNPIARAWVAIPLRTGGRRLGVLTLIFSRTEPLDDSSDQIALRALGSAISDALSRAAEHDSDRDVVMSVQRSLLASSLPEVGGVQLGARYLPAEARNGIGGDWYDAIPLPAGKLMLIVGDVAGHGLEAAITMGQVRSAARALAPRCQPAELLAALDQFICRTFTDPLATAAAVVIDPARRTMRYHVAGHPPPLLRGPDGSVTTLSEGSGVLLGLESSDRPEGVTTFAAGSALVLFTDGLVERRTDSSVDAGICRLASDLADVLPSDPAALCDILVRGSLPLHGREDDTAILSAFLSLSRSAESQEWLVCAAA